LNSEDGGFAFRQWGMSISFRLRNNRIRHTQFPMARPQKSTPYGSPVTIEWRFRNNFWPFTLVQAVFNTAAEANGVVAFRMMKLMRGGRSARREANRKDKPPAIEAAASLVAGVPGMK
jgi:hypothetical protein